MKRVSNRQPPIVPGDKNAPPLLPPHIRRFIDEQRLPAGSSDEDALDAQEIVRHCLLAGAPTADCLFAASWFSHREHPLLLEALGHAVAAVGNLLTMGAPISCIDLAGTTIDGTSADALATGIRHSPWLAALKLRPSALAIADLRLILEAIGASESLECLEVDLPGLHIQDWMGDLVDALEAQGSLTTLVLHAGLASCGFAAVASALRVHPREHLALVRPQARQVISVLKAFGERRPLDLQVLWLQDVSGSPEEIDALLTALVGVLAARDGPLRELKILGPWLTGRQLTRLWRALDGHPRLQCIAIEGLSGKRAGRFQRHVERRNTPQPAGDP